MRQQWGREESAGDWPSSKAVWIIGALFVALAAAGAICAYRYARVWTPLQKHYLTAYLGTEGAGALRKDGRYTLLMVETRKGPAHLALDEEVVPVTTAGGENTFALTDEAVKAGDVKLEWERGLYDNAKLHQALAHWIYNDQSLTDLARPALWGGLGVFVVGLIVAIPKDAARSRERKHGRRLKGPELVTARVSNRRTRADGIGFVQQQKTPRENARQKNLGARAARHRGEPLAHHGRQWHGRIGADPANLARRRSAGRDGHRVRSGARIHAAVLRRQARRSDPESARCANALLGSGR